jgi:Spy/CpxP family protein refolding chaperone
MKPIHAAAIVFGLLAPSAFATSPYAAQAGAPIKALTAEEQSALLDGQGMGFARAAELNGYPGPKHVLELADRLGLSESQREATQALFDRMRSAARSEGAALVEAERVLDELYASRSATTVTVNAQLARIESLRAKLRGLHLNAHLDQAALLSRHQIVMYAQLRGYGATSHQH